MKKSAAYAIAIVLLFLLAGGKTPGSDVGKLAPVEIVQVTRTKHGLEIRTDTGQTGTGLALKDALEDLQAAASREIFLETATWLLTERETLGEMEELSAVFRPNCRICLREGKTDLKKAAAYLTHHNPGITIRDYWKGRMLPELKDKGGRYDLEYRQADTGAADSLDAGGPDTSSGGGCR